MEQKGIARHQIKPINAVLYGAAAGYAVRCLSTEFILGTHFTLALERHIPNRYDQVPDADRWLYRVYGTEVLFCTGLRSQGVEN